jgi:hypothetical protein
VGIKREDACSAPVGATDAPTEEPAPDTAAGPEAAPKARTPREATKQATLIATLRAPDGATIDEIMAALEWAAHTIRGAMAGVLKKKLGLEVTSEKVEGRGRVHKLSAAQKQAIRQGAPPHPGRRSSLLWPCDCGALLDPWHRRPNLRRMPSSRRHALLHMHAVPFGRLWPFPPVTRVVAVPAGGNDVVRGIRTTLGTRMEMLGGAAEDFRQASRPAGYRQTQVQGLIPHVETAVIAESLLCDHLLTAQILKCFHGTDTPFDFMRSECAASQGDAPRQEAYARARPEISWFRRPDSET